MDGERRCENCRWWERFDEEAGTCTNQDLGIRSEADPTYLKPMESLNSFGCNQHEPREGAKDEQ